MCARWALSLGSCVDGPGWAPLPSSVGFGTMQTHGSPAFPSDGGKRRGQMHKSVRLVGCAIAGAVALSMVACSGTPHSLGTCDAGQTKCTGCVDLQTDTANCGACGVVCPNGQ